MEILCAGNLVDQGALFGVEALFFAKSTAFFHMCPEDRQKAFIFPRLLHEIAHAPAHHLDRQFHAPPSRHHDHRERAIQGPYLGQEVETFLAGRRIPRVVEVHQQHVEIARLQALDNGPR